MCLQQTAWGLSWVSLCVTSEQPRVELADIDVPYLTNWPGPFQRLSLSLHVHEVQRGTTQIAQMYASGERLSFTCKLDFSDVGTEFLITIVNTIIAFAITGHEEMKKRS